MIKKHLQGHIVPILGGTLLEIPVLTMGVHYASFFFMDFCHHLSPTGLPAACVVLSSLPSKLTLRQNVVLDATHTSLSFCFLLEHGSAILHLTFRSLMPLYSNYSQSSSFRCTEQMHMCYEKQSYSWVWVMCSENDLHRMAVNYPSYY